MNANDKLRELRIRRWTNRKQCWNHTAVGRKTPRSPSSTGGHSETEYEHTTTPTTSGSSQPPSPTSATNPIRSPRPKSATRPPSVFQVLTWNIDFMQSAGYERTAAALDHIQHEVFKCTDGEAPSPCVLLLQEIHPASLPAVLEHPWIRAHFHVVPVKCSAWPHRDYGNITLVSKTIPVVSAQMLTFWNSAMGRHAVFVDLRVRTSSRKSASQSKSRSRSRSREVTVRIGNVHLESLPYGIQARPAQLAASAEMLRAEGVYAGLVCGDMNAIQAEDREINVGAGLLDAWTEGDDVEGGFTWGHQPVCEFAPGRLDKILYTSDARCKVDKPQRVGVGLKTTSGRWLITTQANVFDSQAQLLLLARAALARLAAYDVHKVSSECHGHRRADLVAPGAFVAASPDDDRRVLAVLDGLGTAPRHGRISAHHREAGQEKKGSRRLKRPMDSSRIIGEHAHCHRA
ncbi:hypothetical protein EIP86_008296 [Pleurotus ostreatoroseus]|nr:hypothetical protein EIP86_008296 [Pleurotus ostreatoroseus]